MIWNRKFSTSDLIRMESISVLNVTRMPNGTAANEGGQWRESCVSYNTRMAEGTALKIVFVLSVLGTVFAGTLSYLELYGS